MDRMFWTLLPFWWSVRKYELGWRTSGTTLAFRAGAAKHHKPGSSNNRPHRSNLCLCWHKAISLQVSPISLCFSLTRTPVIACRVHLDNPEYSPLLQVFKRHLLQHKMTFTLFPCKVTFTGFRGEDVCIYCGGTFLSLPQETSFLGSDNDAVETIGDRMCMSMLSLGNLSGFQSEVCALPGLPPWWLHHLTPSGVGRTFPQLLIPSSCVTLEKV